MLLIWPPGPSKEKTARAQQLRQPRLLQLCLYGGLVRLGPKFESLHGATQENRLTVVEVLWPLQGWSTALLYQLLCNWGHCRFSARSIWPRWKSRLQHISGWLTRSANPTKLLLLVESTAGSEQAVLALAEKGLHARPRNIDFQCDWFERAARGPRWGVESNSARSRLRNVPSEGHSIVGDLFPKQVCLDTAYIWD